MKKTLLFLQPLQIGTLQTNQILVLWVFPIKVTHSLVDLNHINSVKQKQIMNFCSQVQRVIWTVCCRHSSWLPNFVNIFSNGDLIQLLMAIPNGSITKTKNNNKLCCYFMNSNFVLFCFVFFVWFSCIPYQLQRLFAFLQFGERPHYETTQLTKSFGWTQAEAVLHLIVLHWQSVGS